jgi:hypothetical protein
VFGAIDRNRYHNVLVMAVEKPLTPLESIERDAGGLRRRTWSGFLTPTFSRRFQQAGTLGSICF